MRVHYHYGLFFLPVLLRRAEAHHRGRNHTQGHSPGLRNVPAPAAEPPSGPRLPGGVSRNHVPSVQVSRAVYQAALTLAAHPHLFAESPHLTEEVTQRLGQQEAPLAEEGVTGPR